MSWIKDNDNDNENQYSITNDIFYKELLKKNPILEINQKSNLPNIVQDKDLITNFWRRDMSKYSKLTLDLRKPEDRIIQKDIISVYEPETE